ncbi:hypothetical protein FY557_01935 [Chryseobacterium sp. SN22]|uniref:LIC_10190 family membrane protein n=1 Tax=Chryseobacterium sp. SN22 TaxID=2606431 RepID=UPI0011EDDC1F|nr:hypothetical protein [Chryseobacterium sp. SN22]KAA0130508.1 hypothetical protein FY557_01935 [Chryseobacterium sp. SN22]
MLLTLLSTILLIPVLMGLGNIVKYFSEESIHGISGKILSGILGTSILWMILSFFISLNIYVEIPTIILGLLYFFKDKSYKVFFRFSGKEISLICFISFIVLFCGSFYPFILDHFGYYVPTIKWLREFGLVKGISNLDLTLGQMSLWHIFQAGFSNFSDPYFRINTILLVVYSFYIVENKSWIQLCFIPVLLLFSQSPSPDLPVIVFSLIILNEILKTKGNTLFLFTFSVFVFAIKPTMIWLPTLSFLYSVFIIKSRFTALIPGCLLVLLFFMKNIWTFGYPVFPIAVGDLNTAWKPHQEILKTSSQFAIQKTYDMQYSYQEIQKFSPFDYIKNWLFLEGIKSKINILFILSLLGFIIFSRTKKNKTVNLICISILVKSILVLFFSAQYRFFIDVFFVIFFVIFMDYFNRRKSVALFSVLSIIFIGCLTLPDILQTYLPSFRSGNFMGKFEIKQLYRPSAYHYKSHTSHQLGNLKFNVSRKYPYNFETELPAISESYIFDDVKAGIFPQLIDPQKTRKGFIWKKLNPEEEKSAYHMINTIKDSYKQN